jgi:hypothetical protein
VSCLYKDFVKTLCESENLIDIAPLGKATQSSLSQWSKPDDAQRAVMNMGDVSFAFHTNKEQNPWWELTFNEPMFVEYIILHNRKERILQERCRKLMVEIFDGKEYTRIYQGELLFGVEPNGLPLILPCKYQIERIKITLLGDEYFHLSKVNVLVNADKYKNRSIKISYGEDNPDKIFYVIRIPQGNTVGLFAIILDNLTHITYAVKNEYIPIVDLKNVKNQYSDGQSNAWELFFEQPMGYTLDDIATSKNIILSSLWRKQEAYPINPWNIYFQQNKDKFLVFKDIYKKCIKFNQNTLEYIQTDLNAVFQNGRRVLGVLCRGTDYVLKKPKYHAIQPDPIDVIKKAKEVMKKYNCSHIYLATEDEHIYELFKLCFEDTLLTNKQKRFTGAEL